MNDPISIDAVRRPRARRAALARLAANLRWSWHRPSAELLATLPGADPARHPAAVVNTATGSELDEWLIVNGDRVEEMAAELAALEASHPSPEIAYFCPEFGIAAQVPQYSGGLGILAGDHLKAASDLGLPLVGVGLFYRKGFFRQEIVAGVQRERTEAVEPHEVGAVELDVEVVMTIAGEPVHLRVWEQWVGATRLLLLDSDVATNSPLARRITDQLYAGDRRHRLSQELVLGAGGVLALRALGIRPTVWHLNEGHACFLLLERLAELVEGGHSVDDAIDHVRRTSLFTTHTPVPAGIDRFDRDMVVPELAGWSERLGIDPERILTWATLSSDEVDAGDELPFNTAALAFALCGRVNGVSQLHATVSRSLFAELPEAASVEGLTNGVHARTWVTPVLQDLFDECLGAGWDNGDPQAWARVDRIDAHAFGALHRAERARLVDLIADRAGVAFDPDRCVIGFARRFATYKRAALLLRDPDGLRASLEAGAQFVFAGKAHPADEAGKAMLAEIATFARSAGAAGGIAVIPDYDIDIARALYAGSDVWLNNPIWPHEACGTSGEKAALNGVLNCSISDGWWADWYTDGIGWVIPTSDATDPDERDDAEALALHRLLVDDVLVRFDDRGAWFATIAAMWAHLGPLVTAGRMVAEYDRRFYGPIRNRRP
ncbi:MAG: alpha-glucan family phosphorylase [Acidimicrobiales bacterium]